jgi:SAM-dependent methyltransferase
MPDIESAMNSCISTWEHLHFEPTYCPGCSEEHYINSVTNTYNIVKNNHSAANEHLGGLGFRCSTTTHIMRNGSIKVKTPYFDIEQVGKDWVVLDIGCAFGAWAAYLSPFIKEYIGIDVARNIVEIGNKAIRNAGIPNAKLIAVSDPNLDNILDNSIDLIYSTGVFIHTPQIITDAYFSTTRRKLKASGKFAFHMNMTDDPSIHSDADLVHMYSENEYQDLVNKSGLKIIDISDWQIEPRKWSRHIYGTK